MTTKSKKAVDAEPTADAVEYANATADAVPEAHDDQAEVPTPTIVPSEPESVAEEPTSAEQFQDEQPVQLPDFGSEFEANLAEQSRRQWAAAQQQAQSQWMNRQAQQPMMSYTPPGGRGLTLDDIVSNPQIVEQRAAQIAQQQMIPYQQAMQQLQGQLFFSAHRQASKTATQNYSRMVARNNAYKNPKIKEAADNAMRYAINYAYHTGNLSMLESEMLPKAVLFMAQESIGAEPTSVRMRGAEAPTSASQGGRSQRGLSPEQDALRRRLGYTVEQWFENERKGS